MTNIMNDWDNYYNIRISLMPNSVIGITCDSQQHWDYSSDIIRIGSKTAHSNGQYYLEDILGLITPKLFQPILLL
jgi:hypothetical protein